jgi:hypothetical protein
MLHPGLRLRSGRYRLLSRVRAGATAQVWRALDVRDGVEVAIKAVPADAGGAEAVEHEAEAVARVQHPGAVRVLATFEEHGHGLIVMELAACSLADHVESHGPLDGAVARGVALALAEVLGAAHAAGVVHRDVKPQNVLILPDGSVRLADFGIARVHARGHTRTRDLLGTLPFMAPEQRRDARDVRPATDVYALAALLAWMRTGAPPGDLFVPEVADALRGRLRAAGEPDDALLDVIVAAGRYSPAERTADGTRLAEGLRGVGARAVEAQVGGVSIEHAARAQLGIPVPPSALSTSRSEQFRAANMGLGVLIGGGVAFGAWMAFTQLRARPTRLIGAGTLRRCEDAPREWVDRALLAPKESLDGDLVDVDADGIPDAVFSNTYSESVSIWWGERDRMPTQRLDVATGRSVRAPAVGDIDGDGTADLLVPLYNDAGIAVFQGKARSFAHVRRIFQDPAPRTVTLADVNGDSRLDLVTTHESTTNIYVRFADEHAPDGFTSQQKILDAAAVGSNARVFATPEGASIWIASGHDAVRVPILPSGAAGPMERYPLPLTVQHPVREAGRDIPLFVASGEDGMVIVRLEAAGEDPCMLGTFPMGGHVHGVGDLDGDSVPDRISSATCQMCDSNHIFSRGVR